MGVLAVDGRWNKCLVVSVRHLFQCWLLGVRLLTLPDVGSNWILALKKYIILQNNQV